MLRGARDGIGLQLRALFLLRSFGIPLSELQHQHPHKDQGKDSIAGGQDFEVVLSSQHAVARVRVVAHTVDIVEPVLVHAVKSFAVCPHTDNAESFDDVGQVQDDRDHVQHQTAAVKQHIRLGRFVQFPHQPDQTGRGDDVEDANNQIRRVVEKFDVRFNHVEVRARQRGRIP